MTTGTGHRCQPLGIMADSELQLSASWWPPKQLPDSDHIDDAVALFNIAAFLNAEDAQAAPAPPPVDDGGLEDPLGFISSIENIVDHTNNHSFEPKPGLICKECSFNQICESAA